MKAKTLSQKALDIEKLILLIQFFYDRLKFLNLSVNSLIAEACAVAEFKDMAIIHDCKALMDKQIPLHIAWRKTTANTIYNDDITAVIDRIASTLGKADTQSQLVALDFMKLELITKKNEAESYAKQHGKLYQTLGVMFGTAIAVLVI